ncbi:MAG: hypothetical protein KAG53_02870 [Endozoicomonadaceae bacterium]|nr:hypothetical protein [Endozoicomonadaceae bacterium]
MPLNIKLYGGLRQYAENANIELDIQLPQNCHFIKEALIKSLQDGADELVHHCALATEDEILATDAMVVSEKTLSALPPVCGG